jgi:hypothetical protein
LTLQSSPWHRQWKRCSTDRQAPMRASIRYMSPSALKPYCAHPAWWPCVQLRWWARAWFCRGRALHDGATTTRSDNSQAWASHSDTGRPLSGSGPRIAQTHTRGHECGSLLHTDLVCCFAVLLLLHGLMQGWIKLTYNLVQRSLLSNSGSTSC